MGTTYRIAEVAERSGFTAATLRYYEGIGLLSPADRTDAGYRLYDDTSLERLRFIARAKQLGCSLEEVADLAEAWDGGRCGPVQDKLRATVRSKAADAEARIGELTTLAAELQHAAASLGTNHPEAPCGDDCGCSGTPAAGNSTAGTTGTAVPLLAKAEAATGSGTAAEVAGTGDVPVACSLDARDAPTRRREWDTALADVTARRALDDGARLELGPTTDVGEVARLAAAEQSCCRFLTFALVIDDRGTALEVHAPADGSGAVADLFGSPDR